MNEQNSFSNNAEIVVEPISKSQNLKPHRGTMILVFGILGLVCCVIFAILAWVMGNNDLKEMDAGIMDPEGKSLTQAGKICGIIGVVLQIVGFIIWFAMVGFAIIAGAANAS